MNTKEAVSIVKGKSWVLCHEKIRRSNGIFIQQWLQIRKVKQIIDSKNKDTNALINEIRKVLEINEKQNN